MLLNLMRRESAIDNCIERPSSKQLQQMIRRLSEFRTTRPTLVIQHNDYWKPADTYIVIESDGDILLCSEADSDLSFGSVISSEGAANLCKALEYQTLEHRTPVEATQFES